MIGVDLVQVSRIARQVSELGAAFLDRVFTAGEQAHCAGAADRLAARWAAKEATLKAFGWTLAGTDLREIEVVPDEAGRPGIVLHGRAQERAAGVTVSVSMSHDGDYAIATVLLSR